MSETLRRTLRCGTRFLRRFSEMTSILSHASTSPSASSRLLPSGVGVPGGESRSELESERVLPPLPCDGSTGRADLLVESSASAAVSTTHAVPSSSALAPWFPSRSACAAMRLKNLA